MLYFLTIFLSAFLLFLIQPMIAKVILPDFGGGAAVWTVCMLFFQSLLLAGYCYAYLLNRWLQPRLQLFMHGVLVLLAAFTLPIAVDTKMIETSPQFAILASLFSAIGVPYLILSANAPLIQRWFAYDKPTISPYKLYALSNVGSLLGLLVYPFVIEPYMSLKLQLDVWTGIYWLFALCSLSLIVMLFNRLDNSVGDKEKVIDGTKLVDISLWVVLSACGVVALLAVTNAMSQNISSIPFLWLLPLSLYLISFILCFSHEQVSQRRVWFIATAIALPFSLLLFFFASLFSISVQVILFSLILLSICMLAHGELARLKPAVSGLTVYYLAMSVGGVIGGLFINFGAPFIFDQFVEFPLINWCVLVLIFILMCKQYMEVSKPVLWIALVYLLVNGGAFVSINNLYQRFDVVADRNFYGQLAVKDLQVNGFNERRLVDGSTSHGTQSLNALDKSVPLSYYRRNTGVAAAIDSLQAKGKINALVIGLGAGTLAAYGKQEDTFEFLEINPLVKEYATSYFTYLSTSKADVSVTIGDGRQLLQLYPDDYAHVLVVDAFSSDAIPVHLLTLEALELYRDKIVDNGIVALHISNSHLDLVPLVYGLAQKTKLAAAFVLTQGDQRDENTAQWILLSKHPSVLDTIAINRVKSSWPRSIEHPVIWTDDYSNLLSVLK